MRLAYQRELEKYVGAITDLALRDAVNQTLLTVGLGTTDCPGGLHHHHAYHYGLVIHTLEVCDYAIDAARVFKGNQTPSMDVLIAAALCHDVCKTREYVIRKYPDRVFLPVKSLHRYDEEYWVLSDYHKLTHHIHGSFALFYAHAMSAGVSQDVTDAVGHAILSHHGHKDWGSQIEPRTIEAVLLHQVDYLSAQFGATKDRP